MSTSHSQVNIDALNCYFPRNGGVSQDRFVTEGFEAATDFFVLVTGGIEAATDPSIIYGELKHRFSREITPLVKATWGGVTSYTEPTDIYRAVFVFQRDQNNDSFAVQNTFNLVEDPLGIIYSLERSKQHHSASKAILRYIETNFADSNLAAVNLMLKNVELEELSSLSIAGLVRFTARAKKHLPAWSAVYRKAKVVLAKQGENAERVLVGIRE